MRYEQETSNFGMWVFLSTEVMFFGSAIGCFLVSYFLHPAGFAAAARHMAVLSGGLNTGILLTSSFAVALAVEAAEKGKNQLAYRLMLLAAALGVGFLAVKGREYVDHIRDGLWPGPGFRWAEGPPGPAHLFYSFYFFLTGIHALHVLAGILMWMVLAFKTKTGRYNPRSYSPIEVGGLYWHFVDIVWVFLYPLLYLMGAK